MKLFLLKQYERTSEQAIKSCVVIARTYNDAAKTHPLSEVKSLEEWPVCDLWASTPDKVHLEFLGEAAKGAEKGIVCRSALA